MLLQPTFAIKLTWKRKRSGREEVTDTVAFMGNFKEVHSLERSPKWMTSENTDYAQKVVCLGKSHSFQAKSDDCRLNGMFLVFLKIQFWFVSSNDDSCQHGLLLIVVSLCKSRPLWVTLALTDDFLKVILLLKSHLGKRLKTCVSITSPLPDFYVS